MYALIAAFLLRLRFDQRASMAVEFALILPVMAGMWLGTMTICSVYRAETALYNTAQSVANLAANEITSVYGDLNNLCNDAKLSMFPFQTTSSNFNITLAEVTNTSTYTCNNYYTDFYANPPTPANPSVNGCTLTVQYGGGSANVWTWAYTDDGSCPTPLPAIPNSPPASFALPTNYQELAYEPGDSVIEVQANLTYQLGTFPILTKFGRSVIV